VAALIGAGAVPKDLRKAMEAIDFKSFVNSPDRVAPRGISGRLLGLKFPQFADLCLIKVFTRHSKSKIGSEDN